jgi:hypothetical protein
VRRGRGAGHLEQAAGSRQLADEKMRLSATKKIPDESLWVHSRLPEKPGKAPNVIPDETKSRSGIQYCFFWIPDSRFAPSGMTDLMLALKILSFSAAC